MNDPLRLIDDEAARKALGFDVRTLRAPPALDLARGEAQLMTALAQGAAPTYDPTSWGASLSAGAWPAALIAIVATAVAGVVLWWSSPSPTTTASTAATASTASTATTPAAMATTATTATTVTTPAAIEATTSPTLADEPTPTLARRRAGGKPSSTAGATSTTPSSTSSLVEQVRLVEDARAALRDDRAQLALERCERLLERFPHGELVPEARVVRLEALLQLKDLAAVREDADRFLATSESEPYRARVQALRTQAQASQ
jgi:hypothetical protein